MNTQSFIGTIGVIWPLELYGHSCSICLKRIEKEPTFKHNGKLVHKLCFYKKVHVTKNGKELNYG